MKYLLIDTSSKNLTVVVRNGDVIKTYFDPNCGVNHSVMLMPAVEETLKSADVTINDLDFLGCTVGAGSFTGIRIGVSTVKALCFAFNKPCLSITTFDAIAYNSLCGKVLALIDAKHGSFYACGYDNGAVVFPPSFIDKDTVLEMAKEYKLLSFEDIDQLKTEKVSLKDGLIKAGELKAHLKSFDYESLSPLYVRKSQAEEGR
jgi:tRNA threonylcarbamoyl adenosine modification protein YeaZ